MDCDILVLAPHPDDAEIHCGGTIARQVAQGARVVVVDATAGEMGTRGSVQDRARESAAAATILGLTHRACLGLPDGHLNPGDLGQRDVIVDALRRFPAPCVCSMAAPLRHPDHLALHALVTAAIKTAGLHRLVTLSGAPAHADIRHWLFEGELPITPAFFIPLDRDCWERKMASIRCYGSQLHRPDSHEPETSISLPEFLEWIEARGRVWGHHADAPYAEAFSQGTVPPRIADLRDI